MPDHESTSLFVDGVPIPRAVEAAERERPGAINEYVAAALAAAESEPPSPEAQ